MHMPDHDQGWRHGPMAGLEHGYERERERGYESERKRGYESEREREYEHGREHEREEVGQHGSKSSDEHSLEHGRKPGSRLDLRHDLDDADIFYDADLIFADVAARAGGRRAALTLALAAFLFYSSIYFIKVSLFAARWTGHTWHGVEYKVALAIGQSTGYLVGLLVGASGLLPMYYGVPCIFLASGFLASAWSLMIRFLEGRSHTDAIVAFVSLSWIGVSGVVKTVGSALVKGGLSEQHMWGGGLLFLFDTGEGWAKRTAYGT
ncbi:hypothetical protein T492DRAFT_834785 [Pavlovales sp. CCMP2436]|nr:hypothetical protein T492DRAFT_834785 [Pavlovales sp. CCMP2436]